MGLENTVDLSWLGVVYGGLRDHRPGAHLELIDAAERAADAPPAPAPAPAVVEGIVAGDEPGPPRDPAVSAEPAGEGVSHSTPLASSSGAGPSTSTSEAGPSRVTASPRPRPGAPRKRLREEPAPPEEGAVVEAREEGVEAPAAERPPTGVVHLPAVGGIDLRMPSSGHFWYTSSASASL